MEKQELQQLKLTAAKVRKSIIIGTYNAKSGHPGGSLSAADILTYLYCKEMNTDPKNPRMPERDRFVLSKGHAAPVLYATLAECGFFPREDIATLRKPDSYLQGHPDMKGIPGVDMSTGSLGQGISAAVGMALSAKISNESYRTYVVLGDGEIEEGQVWEAAMFAAHNKLDNLVAFIDNNNLQIDGTLEEVVSPYPITDKFAAFGWNTIEIDGNDFEQIESALCEARLEKGRPTAIIASTVKGKGVSFMENQCSWHGSAPNKEQADQALAELDALIASLS